MYEHLVTCNTELSALVPQLPQYVCMNMLDYSISLSTPFLLKSLVLLPQYSLYMLTSLIGLVLVGLSEPTIRYTV